MGFGQPGSAACAEPVASAAIVWPVPTPARSFERRGLVLGAASAVVGWVLVATPASGAPTCAFDQPTATLTIVVGNGESAAIARSGEAITLDGAACGAASVTNTDTVNVDGSAGTPTQVSIDVSAGGFAPGPAPEAEPNPEIEFNLNLPSGSPTVLVIGGTGADHLVLGTGGINLNAAETTGDADVSIVGLPLVRLDGNDGNDELSVAGGHGTGTPATGSLNGGTGDDLLVGGLGGSTLDGGDGSDSVDYSAASQLVLANLATGAVDHAGGQTDQLPGVENLTGSPGGDAIKGGDGSNALDGGVGDDLVIGGLGDDTLEGGEGTDTLAFGKVEEGVTVDLRAGTSEGEGDDAIAGFENVTGTPGPDAIHGDNAPSLILGIRGSDELFGHDGADDLRGGAGHDQLFGQRGDDGSSGGPGRDQLDGGKGEDVCRGGPHPDAFVFCERIVLG